MWRSRRSSKPERTDRSIDWRYLLSWQSLAGLAFSLALVIIGVWVLPYVTDVWTVTHAHR